MVIGVDVAVVAVVFVIVVFVVAAVIAVVVVVVPRDLPLIFGQNRSVTLRYC